MDSGQITSFIKTHFRHFNAASLRAAAEGYKAHLDNGGRMFIALGGAEVAYRSDLQQLSAYAPKECSRIWMRFGWPK